PGPCRRGLSRRIDAATTRANPIQHRFRHTFAMAQRSFGIQPVSEEGQQTLAGSWLPEKRRKTAGAKVRPREGVGRRHDCPTASAAVVDPYSVQRLKEASSSWLSQDA